MAQSLGSYAADATKYGKEPDAAYYALQGAAGAGVSSLQTLTGDLVLASSDSSVVFTTSVGGINLSVPNALPGSVKTVAGTANQIGVVTAAGTATVALAAPSPAPTPGTYLASSITVDGFGRVTAASSSGQSAVALIYNGTTSGPAAGTQTPYAGLNLDATWPNTNSRVYLPLYHDSVVTTNQNILGTTNFPMISGHLYRISISGIFQMSWAAGSAGYTGTLQLGLTTDQAGITNATTLSTPNNYSILGLNSASYVANQVVNVPFSQSFLVLGKGQQPCLYLSAGSPLPNDSTLIVAAALQGSTFSYEDLGLWVNAGNQPAQPTALASSEITTTAFKVSWTQENPQATANAYTLNGVATVPAIDASINNPSGPYAYFNGLTTGTAYTVIITPSNNLGVGTPSAPFVVTTA